MSERTRSGPRVRSVVALVLTATVLVPYAPLLLAIGPPAPSSEPSFSDDGPTGVAAIFGLGLLVVGGAAAAAVIACLVGAALERSAQARAVAADVDALARGGTTLQRWHRAVGSVLVIALAAVGAIELVTAIGVLARAPYALVWLLVALPAETATIAVFGFWWTVVLHRRRGSGLPASERAALVAGTGDRRELRRISAPVRVLPAALAAAVLGLLALIAAVLVTSASPHLG